MKEYTVNLKKINLWLGEEIGMPSYRGNLITSEVQVITATKLESKDLSVEFLFPYHASNYGCLSLKYIPNQTEVLKITINSSNSKETILRDRLSVVLGKTTLGINADYTKVMMDYVMNNEIIKIIPSGELIFYTGANSEIGSSIMSNLFAVEILLNLLPLNEYNFDEKDMEEFIDKCISLCKIKYAKRKEYNNKEKQKNCIEERKKNYTE